MILDTSCGFVTEFNRFERQEPLDIEIAKRNVKPVGLNEFSKIKKTISESCNQQFL